MKNAINKDIPRMTQINGFFEPSKSISKKMPKQNDNATKAKAGGVQVKVNTKAISKHANKPII